MTDSNVTDISPTLKRTRMRAVPINPQVILQLWVTGSLSRIDRGLPKDSKFVYAWFEEDRGMVIMLVEHPSFDEVYHGDSVPVHEVRFTNIPAPDIILE